MRKVYGLLAVQLTITTLIGAVCLFTPGVKELVQGNSWVLLPAFILSIGLLIALHVKRKETPINLILLAASTVVEAYTVGMESIFLYEKPNRLFVQVFWSPSLTRALSSRHSSSPLPWSSASLPTHSRSHRVRN